MEGTIEMRAAQWAASDDTGVSSKAILGVMVGKPPKSRFCYPHDGSDLGRCLGLLEAVPEFRARLSEMKAVGPEWAALVEHWDELEAMHQKKGNYILDPLDLAGESCILRVVRPGLARPQRIPAQRARSRWRKK